MSRRPDGYHDLETIFLPVPLCDELEMLPSFQFSFSQEGIAVTGDVEDNLCVKALRLLQKDFPQVEKVQMHLKKKIPFGAGLGGGSSDAAFVLKMLNEIFDLRLSLIDLQSYAVQLGADCSFFIENVPAYATGIGDILQHCDVPLDGIHLLLLKPNVSVSTTEAYRGIVPRNLWGAKDPHTNLCDAVRRPMEEWGGLIVNDFEDNVFCNHPQIASLKEYLYSQGAVYAAMSGSGATVYGLFRHGVPQRAELPGEVFYFCTTL
jgi:4-diphosphocytidyl-2-C-methyl-D-erythritol kinase